MRNTAILAVIALTGLANGVETLGQPWWRILLWFFLPVAAYLHGRHLRLRRAWHVLVAVSGIGVAIMAVDFFEGVTAMICVGAFVVLPWLAGRFRRQQAELIEMQRDRVARLEREQELTAERARLRECSRIGADIHDTLGHELALIALRAGALEVAAGMSESNREAVAQLRSSAVAATDRLRQTIVTLRVGDAAPVEPPDETVEVLVERARAAGLGAELTEAGDVGALPPLVRRTVHRVVQEALTNAARHAPGGRVAVCVECDCAAVLVTVTNTAAREAPVGSGGGSGLSGLGERVRLLGGSMRAAPDGDGFTVTAWIPETPPGAPGDP